MTALSAALRWGLAIVVGIVAGAIVAFWATSPHGHALTRVPGHPEWVSDAMIGSASANPFVRARIARTGLLALTRDQAMYYIADFDSTGQPLRASCTYELRGKPLPGQWWAITLYAHDLFLARNDDHADHVGSDNIMPAADGTWTVRVAATRDGATNWLSSRNAGAFNLQVRLYQPAANVVSGDRVPDLPVIQRVACQAEGRA